VFTRAETDDVLMKKKKKKKKKDKQTNKQTNFTWRNEVSRHYGQVCKKMSIKKKKKKKKEINK
jgi:hypothetical protein